MTKVWVIYNEWSEAPPDSVWATEELAKERLEWLQDDYHAEDYSWRIIPMEVGAE